MRILFLIVSLLSLNSCWERRVKPNPPSNLKVWGSRPIYSTESVAKQIVYIDSALPVLFPGNIYAKDQLIYQLEIGKGIHVIDNTVSTSAYRMGFITVNGSSEISIKGNFLYTNSYDDLVVIDISDIHNLREVKRVVGTFPEGKFTYFYVQPNESGYYECPRYDSMVIGWKKDSIPYYSCYKN